MMTCPVCGKEAKEVARRNLLTPYECYAYRHHDSVGGTIWCQDKSSMTKQGDILA